ncbi:unnamed protein product [Acanthoscelides obtectus]|uniref:Uncharacterized protein n=1 Tax=Acanthoscelides obtectus TaxID=200917 RepID=A0A9P0NZG8_ACAOB|nr:unnamed protein product [Acanthoscelides obtectus]CAK1627899.1 hypothetical protein AOBTE_LOCUS4890 [Acanthoscelides obtectus]
MKQLQHLQTTDLQDPAPPFITSYGNNCCVIIIMKIAGIRAEKMLRN